MPSQLGENRGRVNVVIMSQPGHGAIEDSPFQMVILTMRFEDTPHQEQVLAFRADAAEAVSEQLAEYAALARQEAELNGRPI